MAGLVEELTLRSEGSLQASQHVVEAVAIRDASSRPRTGMRRVRSVPEMFWAVSASEPSGRSTRPARPSPMSEASTAAPSWISAWVATAASISPRLAAGNCTTTNDPPCSALADGIT